MSDNRSTYPNISTSDFSIEQEMNFTQLNIRFDPTDISILPIFNGVMDLNLDIAPNTVSKHSGNFALWLSLLFAILQFIISNKKSISILFWKKKN